MARFHTTRRVPFPPQTLFDIVADVERYPEFVPLCTGARVWDASDDGPGRTRFRAGLDISYPKLRLRETFVSDVVADRPHLAIRATSAEGPVRAIDNRWLFGAARGGCDIDFHLDYEMSSRALQLAMMAAFDYAFRKIVAAFEERARALALVAPVAVGQSG